ncbi:hypothetical protein [Flavobacterium frigoris]|uniref:ATP-binding protein n=1 Tax=Flavobacterium frigoris TaxID=229204 RepID=A0A1H9MW38_FLAFI|nr:hypothetical protein [Flavobacterium frigoris]SER27727.1 hypothetical protein SAMN05444355_10937 [Flavobacterium frigoris]
MELSDLKLKENPFRTGPSINPKDLIWAGFLELKKKIEDRLSFAMKTSPSRIVLNWGRYGSGKTHAANFYTKTNRLNELSAEKSANQTKSIKINLPRTSKDPVQSFFRSFLGQISLSDMKADFDKVKESLLAHESIDTIIDVNSNDIIISDLFKLIISDDNADKFQAIEAYLFGDATKSTLVKLGLPFGLKDDEQIVNFLSTYINCITFEKRVFSSFILWLDEFEDIDTLNKQSQDRVTTFLRQLFDKTPNHFLLFLNFTPKTFFNIEDLSIILGEALSTRAKIQINFEAPSLNEAINYLEELISPQLNNIQDKFGPFENEETIKYVLENIGNLSIRKINEVFSLIIELAILLGKDKIDIDFIKSVKDEIPSFESKL